MYILLFIALTCNAIASDSIPLLGQSPRSAMILNVEPIGTEHWWIGIGIHPSTVIPRSMDYGYETRQHDWTLATTYTLSAGVTYRLHKHIDILSSVGSLLNDGQLFIPLQGEARIYPFRKRVKPYAFIGMGGMLSSDVVLYGSRGLGINAKMNEHVNFDIQYREMRGDVFMFSAFNPPQVQFYQRGIQATLFMNI